MFHVFHLVVDYSRYACDSDSDIGYGDNCKNTYVAILHAKQKLYGKFLPRNEFNLQNNSIKVGYTLQRIINQK